MMVIDSHTHAWGCPMRKTLRPGDVISMGTPGSVGIFRDPPELLEPGDKVDIEIEGVGTLTNPVVDQED